MIGRASVTPTLGDDYADGYAAGVADGRAGMVAYLDVEMNGAEYVAGYDAGASELNTRKA